MLKVSYLSQDITAGYERRIRKGWRLTVATAFPTDGSAQGEHHEPLIVPLGLILVSDGASVSAELSNVADAKWKRPQPSLCSSAGAVRCQQV